MNRPQLIYHCSSAYADYRSLMLELHGRNGTVVPEAYDSYYVGNPLGEPLLGLCFDGESLVGQENYIRQDIGSGGQLYRGALGINTLVDERYRLFHGVFGKLADITINKMGSEVDILCAFANEESKKYYLKYFNWNIASKVQVYKKVTKASGLNRETVLSFVRPGKVSKDVLLKQVDRFEPEVLDPVLKRHLADSSYSFVYKNADFLNWKLLRNKRYNVVGYYLMVNGSVKGYCVTFNDGFEKKVVDMVIEGDSRSGFEKSISTLAYLSRQEGMRRLVMHATPDCWYERILRSQVFIRRWDFDFITRSFGKALPSTDWVIHIGDFDIF